MKANRSLKIAEMIVSFLILACTVAMLAGHIYKGAGMWAYCCDSLFVYMAYSYTKIVLSHRVKNHGKENK